VQISSLPSFNLNSPQNTRPDNAERVQKLVQREGPRGTDDQRSNSSLDELRARAEEILQQRVEASSAPSNINSRQRVDDDQLPFNVRQALQSFSDNTPSPEQQLGIELAGIDTYV
jgi:hypothetical protein